MYKVAIRYNEEKEVAHFVDGDPYPTPTQTVHDARPEAWKDALGRAAKPRTV